MHKDIYYKGKHKFLIGIMIFFFCSISLCIYFINPGVTLEISYQAPNSNSLNGRGVDVFWDEGEGYSAENLSTATIFKRRAVLSCSDNIGKVQNIRIDFVNTDEEVQIQGIEIRAGIFSIKNITAQEIYASTHFANVEYANMDGNVLVIRPSNGDSQCQLNKWLTDGIIRAVTRFSKLSNYFLMLLNLLLCIVVYFASSYMFREYKKRSLSDKIYYMGCILIVIAAILVVLMALFSKTYAHPDEDVTVSAINYYLNHWQLPDFLSQDARYSFSNYGSTRLGEKTAYYFIAGKIGWVLKNIFHISAYYRGLNCILFLILAVMYCIYGRKNQWMIIGLLLTPQLLYLFSYATSDAWDYFLGYLIIFNILNQESGFNRALRSNNTWIGFSGIVFLGICFSLLIFGKKNYLAVFFICFVILLFRFIRERGRRYILFRKYLMVLIIFFMGVFTRNLMDSTVYGDKKMEQIAIASEQAIGTQEIADLVGNINLKSQGVSLFEMLDRYMFAETSYKSFCGVYGWMEFQSGYFYYMFVFAIYLKVISIQLKYGLLYKRNNLLEKIQVFMPIIVIVLLFCMSLFHSWTSDFQPQGRYLLPSVLGIMWGMHMVREEDCKQKKYIYILAILSFYSFVRYGMLELI